MTNAQRAQRLHQLGEQRRAIELEEIKLRDHFKRHLMEGTARTYGAFTVESTIVHKAYVEAHTRPQFVKISVNPVKQ